MRRPILSVQNIYDDPAFLAGYSELPRSVEGLDGAPEWMSLRAMLPDIGGARVLDLGCGFGWFSRWAAEHGAAEVLGVDLSQRMLERAEADTSSPVVEYRRLDIGELDTGIGPFDLVYSSLALHYVEDIEATLESVHQLLVPGGAFVFSVEHPIFSAPSNPAFVHDESGPRIWPLDRYLDEGPRTTEWFVPGVVKQHRTIATYVNALVAAGFRIAHLEEWGPTPAQMSAHPEWAVERDRPPFLLVWADRP